MNEARHEIRNLYNTDLYERSPSKSHTLIASPLIVTLCPVLSTWPIAPSRLVYLTPGIPQTLFVGGSEPPLYSTVQIVDLDSRITAPGGSEQMSTGRLGPETKFLDYKHVLRLRFSNFFPHAIHTTYLPLYRCRLFFMRRQSQIKISGSCHAESRRMPRIAHRMTKR